MARSKSKAQAPLVVGGAAAAAAAAGVGLKRLKERRDGGIGDSRAYRLLPDEPVAAEVKRVILGRVDDAIEQLSGDVDPAEGVHEARKDLKRIRSALRLARAELGDHVWRGENDHYRDIGRGLSGFRDAEVMVETLDELSKRFGDSARERSSGLRAELESELDRSRDRLEPAMARAAGDLRSGRDRIESLPLKGDGWDLIAPGIHRSYRRGRKRLRAVEESATVENLHEWRKRAKDLWYQLRLIQEADPELIGGLAQHAHDLSDHLGDDHDLALLHRESEARPNAFGEAADQRYLAELIRKRRTELQFAATSLGERIYDRKPKKFTKLLESRWRSR